MDVNHLSAAALVLLSLAAAGGCTAAPADPDEGGTRDALEGQTVGQDQDLSVIDIEPGETLRIALGEADGVEWVLSKAYSLGTLPDPITKLEPAPSGQLPRHTFEWSGPKTQTPGVYTLSFRKQLKSVGGDTLADPRAHRVPLEFFGAAVGSARFVVKVGHETPNHIVIHPKVDPGNVSFFAQDVFVPAGWTFAVNLPSNTSTSAAYGWNVSTLEWAPGPAPRRAADAFEQTARATTSATGAGQTTTFTFGPPDAAALALPRTQYAYVEFRPASAADASRVRVILKPFRSTL
jgi:hypothetical protein